jgi:hypothetical protein
MNLKNALFSAALSVAIVSPSFANHLTTVKSEPTKKSITVEISDLIKDIDFTHMGITNESVKLKFMVNENNELIVLSTNNEKLDSKLKSNLNYRKINADNVDAYQIYIVPIKLEE